MKDAMTPPRQEFERRFLVIVPFLPAVLPAPARIRQGYTLIEPYQVRFRFVDEKAAFLQLKAKDHFESDELPIPVDQAQHMLDGYRAPGSLDILKDRSAFPPRPDGRYWEYDAFLAENLGLHIAEIETPAEDYPLDPATFPAWVGPEITDDPRFKNKNLTLRPFLSWPEEDRLEVLRLTHQLP
jgi:adenylate cyclase